MAGTSIAGYARHRRKLGLPGQTAQSVKHALADGRISRAADGTIDPENADRDWEANTDQQRKSEPGLALQRARAAKAELEARRAQLDYDERRGELVNMKEVERRWFSLTRQARDRLMQIAPRLAGELAGETSARVIEERMSKEVRDALEILTMNGDGGCDG